MKEQIKQILLKLLKEKNEKLAIDSDYRFWSKFYNGKYVKEIDMNPMSFSIFYDSLTASNPNSAYIVSLINFFQTLEISAEDSPHRYMSYSHSVTTYYLRLLAKYGLIEIQTLKYEGKPFDIDLSAYYETLGNPVRGKIFKMYTVIFQKVRNLDARDIELIERCLHAFNIPADEIDLKIDNALLQANISITAVRKSIASGNFSHKLAESLKILLEDYISPEDYDRIKKFLPKGKLNR